MWSSWPWVTKKPFTREAFCLRRSLSPTAKVGHIGLYRDEQTLEAKEYYFKLPADADKGQCLIVDPALATGATAVAAIDLLKSVGVERIKFMCIFSSLTGISAVHSKHPDVAIYTPDS